MKTIYTILGFLFLTITSQAQGKYLTKQGDISFSSNTPVEDIEAENNQVLSVLNTKDGTIGIAILMKSFMFEKSLMQEHFNENYVESDKYPKATFKGTIQDYNTYKTGTHKVLIHGDLMIHGVTKKVEINATLTKEKQQILLNGTFPIKITDFKIEIPSAVTNNIANTVDVSFKLNHKSYTK